MSTITIREKNFKICLSSEKIQNRISELAKQISSDLNGTRPLFICVLNGAFIFTADLFKRITTEAEVTFIRVSSYEGMQSSGVVRNLVGISESLSGRTIVLVEDIIDTGDTAVYLIEEIRKQNPAKIYFASLLLKPKALRQKINIDYLGFEVPNDFLIGYGLDYDGLGRNLQDIYMLT